MMKDVSKRNRWEHIAFDFDGTLCRHLFPDWPEHLYPWVKPLFRELHGLGCVIWVYSARFNKDFYGDQAILWFAEAKKFLEKEGISEYIRLTPYKPPASLIFDDRGWNLEGGDERSVRIALRKIKEFL